MYKLLIVDDEQVEREGLRAILLKSMPELEIRLAKNGAAAIECCRNFDPDLVLMDIKMPGMSGLEAIERIQEEHPGIKFIMVTAYEMFEYARIALKLGVNDYLLKPSRAVEIVETVTNALQEIALERAKHQQQRHTEERLKQMLPVVEADVVTQLLFDHVHDVHLQELIPLLGGNWTEEAFVMLLAFSGNVPQEQHYAALREKMRQLGSGWVGALSGKQIPLVVFRRSGRSYRAQAASLAQQLLTLTGRFPTVSIFIGIGGAYETLEDVRLSYQEALIAAADTSLPAKHRFYEDMPAINDLKEDFPSKQMEKQFIETIRRGQWDEVQALLMDYIGRYEKNGFGLIHTGQRVLETLWVVAGVLSEAGIETGKPTLSFRMQSYRELRAETECVLAKLRKAAEAHGRNVEPDAASRLQHYIREHSHEELSLERLAAMVNLSPFYISKLFKEEIGINYIDFLTECRMDSAKTLLMDPALSLKEIAYSVGYHDPNYFSKVFKKAVGQAPSEYRKRLVNRRTV